MESDLLDSLLGIEEQFYQEGHSLGVADGTQAGYAEGSVFAVEKGFEKFLEVGRLYGKALVWKQRLVGSNLLEPGRAKMDKDVELSADSASIEAEASLVDPVICRGMSSPPRNARLTKNIQNLLSQVDPATLSLENTEDTVSEVEERLKRASLKAKLIQRVLGEREDVLENIHRPAGKDVQIQGDVTGNIEDISSLGIRP
jgi:Essential protein Yae1, N terminal